MSKVISVVESKNITSSSSAGLDDSTSQTKNNLIYLNVGGSSYIIDEVLLSKFPEGCPILSNFKNTFKTEGNCMTNPLIFANRDGQSFKWILNFLRNEGSNDWVENLSLSELNLLQNECKFFCCEELGKMVDNVYKNKCKKPVTKKTVYKVGTCSFYYSNIYEKWSEFFFEWLKNGYEPVGSPFMIYLANTNGHRGSYGQIFKKEVNE